MKRRPLLYAAGLVVLAVLLLVGVSCRDGREEWTYLGSENYQAVCDGIPIVFNALQDEDRRQISNLVNKLGDTTLVDQWWDTWKSTYSRPDILPPLRFYRITPRNTLGEMQYEVFEITYEGDEGTKKAGLAKLELDGRSILTPVDPEIWGLCGSFIPAPQKTRYLIPTMNGLWLVDAGTKQPVKISSDLFDGKTREQLTQELRALLPIDIEGPVTIWWNSNPVFSPDGTKIVYTTNRDFTGGNGDSIWLHDLATGMEKPLKANAKGEWSRVEGWLDDRHIVYKNLLDPKAHFVMDIEGKRSVLKLEGADPEIVAVFEGMIAYKPDISKGDKVCVAKIDLRDYSVTQLYERSIDGYVFGESVSFSPDASKLAFTYRIGEGYFVKLSVVDLKSGKEMATEQNSVEGRIVGHLIKWLDNKRLLVNTMEEPRDGDDPRISAWIYTAKR